MLDWELAAICADCVTPSCKVFETESRRCVTDWPIAAICPALWACAVAIVCRSRRNSFICDSTPCVRRWLCAFCSATHTTSTATAIRLATRKTVMQSPEPCAYSLLACKDSENGTQKKRLPAQAGSLECFAVLRYQASFSAN